jgi:hypothetical protein
MPSELSAREQDQFVEDINCKMNFMNSTLQLKKSDFVPVDAKRSCFKSMCNSIFGKFGQRDDFPDTHYVSSQEEIDDLLKNGKEIRSTFSFSKGCQIQCKSEEPKVSPYSNCVLTAFINALSRIDMHKHFICLLKQNCKLFYTDTDNIYFSCSKNIQPNIPIGHSFGEFKHEFGKLAVIESFYAICVHYKDNIKEKTKIKVRALALSSKEAAQQISADLFKDFLKSYKEGHKRLVSIPQSRSKLCLKEIATGKEIQYFNFSNDVKCQRRVDKTNIWMKTYPWGYKL